MDPSRFMTHTLRSQPWGSKVARIMAAAIDAVEPGKAVREHMKFDGSTLETNGEIINLDRFNRIFLIGAGKAGEPMTEAVLKILGDRVDRGVVVVKEGYSSRRNKTNQVEIIEAGHPIPDERGTQATEKIIRLLEDTRHDDLLIFLISGGGSALLLSPVQGVTLQDIQTLTAELLASGASINEINTLRKHLDQVKGGQIARYSAPAKLVSLILSDVVGDPLDIIASGPTVPDPSSYEEAIAIIDRYQIVNQIPQSILKHLERGMNGTEPETPKPGDPVFENVINTIIASNRTAAQKAIQQAEEEGFKSMLLTNYLQGEANQVGRTLAAILKQMAINNQPLPHPACIVIGGETTVTLIGNGLGGRNQEIALAATRELEGLKDIALITLATDGGDGPTDAAGAVVNGETHQRAQVLQLDPQRFLANNDAYNFFNSLDDLIITGPTKTNVNDLAFLFTF
jgi:glycerate 2-kinase